MSSDMQYHLLHSVPPDNGTVHHTLLRCAVLLDEDKQSNIRANTSETV